MDYKEIASHYMGPNICACALMGSRARGDHGKLSDIDFLRIIDPSREKADDSREKPPINDLVAGVLTSVMTKTVKNIDTWFRNPVIATETIQGLRDSQILYDAKGIFLSIKKKAAEFTWDDDLQKHANDFAGNELVGWAEEAYKGIEGCIRKDVGRMLNARFGLSWGLAKIMRVYKGVLITSDNTFLAELEKSPDIDPLWFEKLLYAFGISRGKLAPTISEQVFSGLELYVQTYEIVREGLNDRQKKIIGHTVELICDFLAKHKL